MASSLYSGVLDTHLYTLEQRFYNPESLGYRTKADLPMESKVTVQSNAPFEVQRSGYNLAGETIELNILTAISNILEVTFSFEYSGGRRS